MPDIFDRPGQQFGGSFASDAAKIVFAGAGEILGGGGVGLLTQNLQVGYTQQVTQLYEIGTNYVFLVCGRARGQVSIGRVLGPRPVQTAFYRKYGNVCNAATNNIAIQAEMGCQGQGGSGQVSFHIKNLVLTSVAITVAAENMILNEQLGAQFVSLEL